jgi:hypothetical protein
VARWYTSDRHELLGMTSLSHLVQHHSLEPFARVFLSCRATFQVFASPVKHFGIFVRTAIPRIVLFGVSFTLASMQLAILSSIISSLIFRRAVVLRFY